KELCFQLFRHTEYMSVILCKAAHSGQSMQLATLFIAVNRPEFCNPNGQFPVGMWTMFIYLTVVRAVHRFKEKFFIIPWCTDRLKTILTILGVVAGTHIQIFLADVRRDYRFVSSLFLFFF